MNKILIANRGEIAVKAAKIAGYTNSGTVEFLVCQTQKAIVKEFV